MSRYLVDRIAATPNIELRTHARLVGLAGSRDSGVESISWCGPDGETEQRPL